MSYNRKSDCLHTGVTGINFRFTTDYYEDCDEVWPENTDYAWTKEITDLSEYGSW